MVYSIAFRFFHNSATAEEVAQDVFLRLYEGHRSVGTGAHCMAWLRRSTVHRCIDTVRRSSYGNEVQMDTLPDIPVGAPETAPLLQERLRGMIAAYQSHPLHR